MRQRHGKHGMDAWMEEARLKSVQVEKCEFVSKRSDAVVVVIETQFELTANKTNNKFD